MEILGFDECEVHTNLSKHEIIDVINELKQKIASHQMTKKDSEDFFGAAIVWVGPVFRPTEIESHLKIA